MCRSQTREALTMAIEFNAEKVFDSRGLALAAKEWGRPGSLPVIALHGWLDNAASFDRLLSHMTDVHVLAMDSAGHGMSDFRSPDSGYDIWQDIADVLAIADQMGWDQFTLLGHSRGAIIAALTAGTAPQRIRHLAMIDGHVPVPVENHNAARQMAKSIRDQRRFGASSPSFFPSFERAVTARADGFLTLERDAAAVLAKRGVRQSDRGFYWHNDQRLKAASTIKLTREHIESFLTAIEAPTLLIHAQDSVFTADDQQAELFAWISRLKVIDMPGSHHLHMERQSLEVAQAIQAFFR